MSTLFAIGATILIAGWLWYFVAQPILESWGVVSTVNNNDDVMSYAEDAPAQEVPSSLQTRQQTAPDRPMMPVPTQDKILDIFRAMRAANMKRDAVSSVWRAAGLPFDNNLWTKAAPLIDEPTEHAPISGRPLPPGVKFHEDDPELEYKPLRV